MKKRFELSTVVLLFLMAFAASCIVTAHAVDVAKLQAANTAFEEAFEAVLAAEHAGANVTVLLSQLNAAADLLAQAEMACRNGDASVAGSKASSAFLIVLEVKSEAVNAENAALVAYQNGFWLSTVLSIIGASGLVTLLFLAWKLLKQRYLKKLLGARPEVPNP